MRDAAANLCSRGRRLFREYDDADNDEFDADSREELARELGNSRPLTRSQLKPKLLFPKIEKDQSTLEAEEAVTDVEEDMLNEPPTPEETPSKRATKRAGDVLLGISAKKTRV